MPCAAIVLTLLLTPALLAGCSDLGSAICPENQVRVDGACVSPGFGGTGGENTFPNPEPQTQGLRLGCANNLTTGIATNLVWKLSVDPGPIVSSEVFGAAFRGSAVFSEDFLDEAQQPVPGGVHRVELLELRATVHVRAGVGPDAPDTVLRLDVDDTTCRYDAAGEAGVTAGPFPVCDPVNDNPDESNDDCTSLGGEPRPENQCGRFVTAPTSTDCSPGGLCDQLGKLQSQCEPNGFCVTGSVEIPLTGAGEAYIAATEGEVLFGWADETVAGYPIDQSGGPNHGTIIIPQPAFDDPVGPIGIRVRVGAIDVALECVMGIDCRGPYGTGDTYGTPCRDALPSRTPDIILIRFPIHVP